MIKLKLKWKTKSNVENKKKIENSQKPFWCATIESCIKYTNNTWLFISYQALFDFLAAPSLKSINKGGRVQRLIAKLRKAFRATNKALINAFYSDALYKLLFFYLLFITVLAFILKDCTCHIQNTHELYLKKNIFILLKVTYQLY